MRRMVLTPLPILALLLVAACGQSDSPRSPATGGTTAAAAGVDVGQDPIGITAAPSGDLWVVLAGDRSVVRVDAADNSVSTAVPVPGTPLRVTAAEGGAALWVTAFTNGAVVRVDTATGTLTDKVLVGDGAEGVTEAFGSIWVAVQDDGLLVQVDPKTRKVVRKIDVGPGVRLVVAGTDALWLADHVTGAVIRVDPKTYRVRRGEAACDGPEDLVASGPTTWVTCSVSEELVGVSASDLSVSRRIPLAGTPDAITSAPDGSLLLVLQDGPTLVRLDSSTGAEISRTRLGEQKQLNDQANLDIAVTADDAWITSFAEDRVLRTPWAG